MSTRSAQQGASRDCLPADEAALHWYLRKRDGLTATEEADLQCWLQESQTHRDSFAELAALWHDQALRVATEAVQIPANTNAPRRLLLRVVAVAAVLALVSFIGPDLLLRLRSDYLTAAGQMQEVVLPDGSVMRLNTASAVALDFTDQHRGVTLLAGEAFFAVEHDAGRPFTVRSPYAEVLVTGTEFSVAAGDGADLVTLREGHVQITQRTGGKELSLQQGQEARISVLALEQTASDTEARLAWLDGRIEIGVLPARQAIAEVARYMDGRVVYLPGTSAEQPVSGSFLTSEPETAIRTMVAAAGLSLSELPGGILVIR